MKYFRLLLIIIITASPSLTAQNIWGDDYQNAYHEVLKLNFKKSDSLLYNISIKNKAAEAYVKSTNFFLNALLNNYTDDVLKNDSLSYFLDIVNSNENDSPWINYFQIEILTMKSLINARLDNKMSSVYSIYKASKLTKSSLSDYPNFAPIKTLHGFQLCTFSQIPDNYKSIASFFGIEGNYEEGITEISSSLNNINSSIIKNKSEFIYIFSQKEFGNNNTVRISNKVDNYQQYPVMIYYEAYLQYKDSNIEKAKEILLKNEDVWQNKMNYLNYFTGKLLTFSIDSLAKNYFSKFLENTKTDNFKISTYRYLAYLELINGNNIEYSEYVDKIENNTFNSASETDKSALNEISNNKEITLIKTQLLYDGGKYIEAEKTILSKPKNQICNNENDFIIYYYRLGSIYLKLDEIKNASENFERCTKFVFNNNFHYQANAFLHLGEIYIKENKKEKAKLHLEKCLDLEDFPYSYSIHNKAEALLDNL